MAPPRVRSSRGVPAVQGGDVDLTGARLQQSAGHPVVADHLGEVDHLVAAEDAHVGHELGDGTVHHAHVVEVGVRRDPYERKWFHQWSAEPVGRIFHECTTRRREQSDRASAIALEERGDRSAGRVERERGLHLQEAHRAISGQLVSDRHPGDAAADHEHVVGTHRAQLVIRRRSLCVSTGYPAGTGPIRR